MTTLSEWLKQSGNIEEQNKPTQNLSAWLSKSDPSIPDAIPGEIPGTGINMPSAPTEERDLSLRQKGVNLAAKYAKQNPLEDLYNNIISGTPIPNYGDRDGPSAPFPKITPSQEQLDYEGINPLYSTYEAGKTILGDLASFGSAGGGYALDQLNRLNPMGDDQIKPFSQRMAESNFRADVTEKGQLYRQKFDENTPAIMGLNQIAALSRLKDVNALTQSGLKASQVNPTWMNTAGNKIARVVGDEVADITQAVGSRLPKTLIGNETRAEWAKQQLLRRGIKPTQKQQEIQGSFGGRSAYDDAVEIIYKDNINLDAKGIQKIRDNANRVNREMEDFIEANKNISIRKNDIFNENAINRVRQSYVEAAGGSKDLKAFDRVIDEFRALNKGKTFTVKDAQKWKTNTYKLMNESAYKPGSQADAGTIAAQKYIARTLKEEIERVTSRLGIDGKPINKAKEINREAQKYINALDVVTKREFVSGRSNPIHGLALLAHDPMLGVGQAIQSSSPFLVGSARFINKLQNTNPVRNALSPELGLLSNAAKKSKMSTVDNLRAAGLLQLNEEDEDNPMMNILDGGR